MEIESAIQDMLSENIVLQSHALMSLKTVNDQELALERAQLLWDADYSEFVSQEATIPAPDGGRWNDAKRLAYVQSQHPSDWDNLCRAKTALRIARLELGQIGEQVSGLNRRIRLYEILANSDLAKAALAKLAS